MRARLKTLLNPNNKAAVELVTHLAGGKASDFQTLGRAFLSMDVNVIGATEVTVGEGEDGEIVVQPRTSMRLPG